MAGGCDELDVPVVKLPAGWPVQVSYTYEANGRLHVSARLKGRKEGVTTDFVRENSLPDEDLETWARCIDEELHAAAAPA